MLLAVAAAPVSAYAGGARTSPAAEVQLDEGLTALYSLDYAKARRASRKLIELEPDNPFGYLFEAGAIWWQASQEYGLFKDTPTLQGLFEQDIEAGVRKSSAYIDSKDKQTKADGYYVSGMTLGVRGQWNLMKGRWLDAYFDGKKAAQMLASIYLIDLHDDARALALIQGLRKDFPGSPYFVFLEAMLRHRLGDWDGSLALGRELHDAVAADPRAFRHKWLTLACGLSGPACLSRPDMERTLVWLDHAVESTAKEKNGTFRTLTLLVRGQVLDVLGRRDDAVKDYQKVEFMPPLGDSRDVARACLAAPCGRDAVLKRLRELSKEED